MPKPQDLTAPPLFHWGRIFTDLFGLAATSLLNNMDKPMSQETPTRVGACAMLTWTEAYIIPMHKGLCIYLFIHLDAINFIMYFHFAEVGVKTRLHRGAGEEATLSATWSASRSYRSFGSFIVSFGWTWSDIGDVRDLPLSMIHY